MCRENDVAAIDVNMGCPKEYSTKVVMSDTVSSQQIVNEWSGSSDLI